MAGLASDGILGGPAGIALPGTLLETLVVVVVAVGTSLVAVVVEVFVRCRRLLLVVDPFLGSLLLVAVVVGSLLLVLARDDDLV